MPTKLLKNYMAEPKPKAESLEKKEEQVPIIPIKI
jgi:hypothetical protein